MIPDIDLQLQVSIKALLDTIAPAVDPTNKMAVEQLGLTVATLNMVRNRLPLSRRLARAALDDAVGLAEALAGSLRGAGKATILDGLVERGRVALQDPACDTHDLAAGVAELNRACSEIVQEAPDGPLGAAIEAIVLERSATRIQLGRAWFLPAGFEPRPETIPPIEQLLK